MSLKLIERTINKILSIECFFNILQTDIFFDYIVFFIKKSKNKSKKYITLLDNMLINLNSEISLVKIFDSLKIGTKYRKSFLWQFESDYTDYIKESFDKIKQFNYENLKNFVFVNFYLNKSNCFFPEIREILVKLFRRVYSIMHTFKCLCQYYYSLNENNLNPESLSEIYHLLYKLINSSIEFKVRI